MLDKYCVDSLLCPYKTLEGICKCKERCEFQRPRINLVFPQNNGVYPNRVDEGKIFS